MARGMESAIVGLNLDSSVVIAAERKGRIGLLPPLTGGSAELMLGHW